MTDWIKWNGGECPIKSDKTRVEYKLKNGFQAIRFGKSLGWGRDSVDSYRITEDHEPKEQTREQLTTQIEALQKQLDAFPVVRRKYWDGQSSYSIRDGDATHYFDIETINGVPHIHGVAMKEVDK